MREIKRRYRSISPRRGLNPYLQNSKSLLGSGSSSYLPFRSSCNGYRPLHFATRSLTSPLPLLGLCLSVCAHKGRDFVNAPVVYIYGNERTVFEPPIIPFDIRTRNGLDFNIFNDHTKRFGND